MESNNEVLKILEANDRATLENMANDYIKDKGVVMFDINARTEKGIKKSIDEYDKVISTEYNTTIYTIVLLCIVDPKEPDKKPSGFFKR